MKKKSLSMLLAIIMLMNILTLCVFAQDEQTTEKEIYNIQISGTADYEKSYDLFDRINNYRGVNKFDAFTTDKRLIDAAMQRAAECAVYFSTARPDDIDNPDSFESVIPEELAKGTYEYDTAIIKNIDELFNDEASVFYKFLKSGYKTIGVGMVYHNGIYYCSILSSNICGTAEETRTLTHETTDFNISCEKAVLEQTLTEPENLTLDNGKTDSVFFEGVNLGWKSVRFIINPEQITVSDENVISAELMKNAVKVTALSLGESYITFTLKSADEKNTITGKIAVNVKEPEPEPVVVMGDVTGDGNLTVVDAKWMLQILSGSRKLTNEMIAVIDVNSDGNLSVVDAKWVLQALAGVRDKTTFELVKK